MGLLNPGIAWGDQVNYLARFLGEASTITRIVYVVMGIAGIAALVKMFGMSCPGCGKKKDKRKRDTLFYGLVLFY